MKEFTEWLDSTSPTTPEKPQPARRSPNLNQKPRVDDHLEADIEKLLPKSPVPASTVADEPVETSAAPASAPTAAGISPSPETRAPGLGIGTAEDANAAIDWIHSLQHVGATTTARVPEPAFADAAAAIPASSPQEPPPAIPIYDTSTPITALYRVSQSDLGTLLKHSEAPRLRFWIRKLREELIREAAWNRKSNAEIASLRRLVDSQQRELMDSRVKVAHLEASLTACAVSTSISRRCSIWLSRQLGWLGRHASTRNPSATATRPRSRGCKRKTKRCERSWFLPG